VTRCDGLTAIGVCLQVMNREDTPIDSISQTLLTRVVDKQEQILYAVGFDVFVFDISDAFVSAVAGAGSVSVRTQLQLHHQQHQQHARASGDGHKRKHGDIHDQNSDNNHSNGNGVSPATAQQALDPAAHKHKHHKHSHSQSHSQSQSHPSSRHSSPSSSASPSSPRNGLDSAAQDPLTQTSAAIDRCLQLALCVCRHHPNVFAALNLDILGWSCVIINRIHCLLNVSMVLCGEM
jgi:hypothetical protein